MPRHARYAIDELPLFALPSFGDRDATLRSAPVRQATPTPVVGLSFGPLPSTAPQPQGAPVQVPLRHLVEVTLLGVGVGAFLAAAAAILI
ncbi:MAG: hypothetical protein JXX28_17480 [Deltaproteobacteria bacterium]|nr:hypothetical protein [Deltaproteobacteria bacterium]